MPRFFNTSATVNLVLTKKLVRSIKRGHPWIYSFAVRDLPKAPAGSYAVLKDRKGEKLASGYYDPGSPIVFRICSLGSFSPNRSGHIEAALARCLKHRRDCVGPETTGYRLINGEGDGLPGIVCDVYADTAVLNFDGEGAAKFWNRDDFAGWLAGEAGIENVIVKTRRLASTPAESIVLAGTVPDEVVFRENGVTFSANVARGQKTGFFLDQRDNRRMIRRFAKDRRVLNLFGYTGGFSVYAGLGGAAHVTTVDQSRPAVETATVNWELNGLDPAAHDAVAADAFEYIETKTKAKEQWDLVIVDPPSFAPSEEDVPRATKAYEGLFAGACRLLKSGGLLALSSCSSHIGHDAFLAICVEAVSKARRRARVIRIGGQPADHPFPIASPEFRYLKFVLLAVEE